MEPYSGSLIDLVVDNFDGSEHEMIMLFRPEGSDETYRVSFDDPTAAPEVGVSFETLGHPDASDPDLIHLMTANLVRRHRAALGASSDSGPVQERVLVLLAQSDSHRLNLGAACSPTDIDRAWFSTADSVASTYASLSTNQTEVSGQVVTAPVELGRLGGSCRLNAWAKRALAAYPGDSRAFNRHVIVLPAAAACGAAGLAHITAPGERSRLWINDRYACDVGVLTHELGHSFGMHHAWKGGSPYGDLTDVMGFPRSQTLNAPHRMQMGWTPNRDVAEALEGDYEMQSLDVETPSTSTHPRVLQLSDRGRDPLFIAYRTADGLGRTLHPSVHNHVTVHRQHPGRRTELLATLAAGETYDDRGPGGISIRLLSTRRGLANVRISGGHDVSTDGNIQARMLSFSKRRANGWVVDEDSPTTPIVVEIWYDDLRYTQIVANLPYAGWRRHFPAGADSDHRFNLRLPRAPYNEDTISIWALDVDSSGAPTGERVLLDSIHVTPRGG